MSMSWSNPSNKSGIVEKTDALLGTTSDSYPIDEKVRDGNLGLDRALTVITAAGGKWKFDDNNHEDLPFMETALIQGQRDYKFDETQNGELVLQIHKAMIRQQDTGSQAGIYMGMEPVDMESERGTSQFWDGKDVEAISNRYSKNGMSIILENPPSFSQDDSLKVFIDREASYFDVDDTTKKPGFAGLFHGYIAKFMAREYAEANLLTIYDRLNGDIVQIEADMTAFYGARARDERQIFRPKITRFM